MDLLSEEERNIINQFNQKVQQQRMSNQKRDNNDEISYNVKYSELIMKEQRQVQDLDKLNDQQQQKLIKPQKSLTPVIFNELSKDKLGNCRDPLTNIQNESKSRNTLNGYSPKSYVDQKIKSKLGSMLIEDSNIRQNQENNINLHFKKRASSQFNERIIENNNINNQSPPKNIVSQKISQLSQQQYPTQGQQASSSPAINSIKTSNSQRQSSLQDKQFAALIPSKDNRLFVPSVKLFECEADKENNSFTNNCLASSNQMTFSKINASNIENNNYFESKPMQTECSKISLSQIPHVNINNTSQSGLLEEKLKRETELIHRQVNDIIKQGSLKNINKNSKSWISLLNQNSCEDLQQDGQQQKSFQRPNRISTLQEDQNNNSNISQQQINRQQLTQECPERDYQHGDRIESKSNNNQFNNRETSSKKKKGNNSNKKEKSYPSQKIQKENIQPNQSFSPDQKLQQKSPTFSLRKDSNTRSIHSTNSNNKLPFHHRSNSKGQQINIKQQVSQKEQKKQSCSIKQKEGKKIIVSANNLKVKISDSKQENIKHLNKKKRNSVCQHNPEDEHILSQEYASKQEQLHNQLYQQLLKLLKLRKNEDKFFQTVVQTHINDCSDFRKFVRDFMQDELELAKKEKNLK